MNSIEEIFDNSNQLIDGIHHFFDRYIGNSLLRKSGIHKILAEGLTAAKKLKSFICSGYAPGDDYYGTVLYRRAGSCRARPRFLQVRGITGCRFQFRMRIDLWEMIHPKSGRREHHGREDARINPGRNGKSERRIRSRSAA